jgi:hypothetical protein
LVLSVTEKSLFDSLSATLGLSRATTRKLNDAYEGTNKLEQLGLSIPPELANFSVVLNWPRVAVDAVEQRLDVQGFRMPGQPADKYLWENWQYNNLDERQTFAHTDALALARSYVCVGTNEVDREHPLVTIESPNEMVAVRDRGRTGLSQLCACTTPTIRGLTSGRRSICRTARCWLRRSDAFGVWADEFTPDVHNLGAPPVVALVNRNRATRLVGSILEGVSEMADVIPIADSASRAITTAQLVQETLAAPTRGVLGATKGDFVGADGQPLAAWQAWAGAVWALGNKDAKTFQFDAADMSNYENAINMYARLASGVSSLPIEYFGLNTQNAPSAEGQRAGETRLIKKAERKQTGFGHSWESVQRLVLRFKTGEWDPAARGLETIWRDAGTPTVAQVTDAVVKRFQAGLVDWETAQERLGESPAAIEQMKTRRQTDSAAALSFGVQSAANNL